MSKRPKKNAGAPVSPPPAPRRAGKQKLVAALLAAGALLSAGFAATRVERVRSAVGLRPLSGPLAQGAAGLPLAKEYVYAGGRLVATEEPAPQPTPTPTPAGPPPSNLVATADFSAGSGAFVRLTWQAPPTAPAVASYLVERRKAGSGFNTVAAVQGATSYDDAADVQPGAAYLYRVSAVFDGGGSSAPSNPDIATVVAFTDASLQGVTIKAAHLIELRRAVEAVRELAGGLGPFNWTHPDPISSPAAQRRVIYAADVADLRSRLGEALLPLGLPGQYPNDPPLSAGAVVMAAHFEQIRSRVR